MWVAERCAGARVGFLTGGRLMDEDYYALSKLARTVIGTNDLDHRRDDGGRAEAWAAAHPMGVTYKDVERASVILVAGLDAEQEVPILHLRLRKAARRGARIVVLHPRRTRLHDVAEHVLCAPGEERSIFEEAAAGAGPLADVVAALREAGGSGVVLAGQRLASGPPGAADAALDLAAGLGARFQYVTRRGNDRGALIAGVHPRLLPGGRRVDDSDARTEVERVWGPVMAADPGRDWRGILEAAADGELDVLFLIGVDPITDYPDAELARRALDNVAVKVVQSLELGSLARYADVFLPAAAFVEKDGHVTTWEGRGQRIRPVRAVEGISRPDWEIFAGLAAAMGGDLGFDTLEELHDDMGRILPTDQASARTGLARATPAPAADRPEGTLTLFSYHLLVDEGRLSERADELKAALGDEAFVEVHPDDAAGLGLEGGGRALVRTGVGQAELPVHVSAHIARGAAFVPFNSAGLRANTLLSGSFVTTATLEAVAAGAATPAAGDPPEAGSAPTAEEVPV